MNVNAVDAGAASVGSSLDFDARLNDLGGDVNARVAAMVLGAARDSRDAADQARVAEEENLREQEAQQVQAMHEQADAIRAAGNWALGGAIVSGGTQLVGAAGGFGGDREPYETGGKLVGAAAQYGGKLEDAHKTDLDATETTAKNHVEASTRRLGDIKELRSDARDLKQAAVDFLRESTRTRGEIDRAPLSIRG
jgi:hypothetical protein